MTSVIFQEGEFEGSAILFFEYGIVELGAPGREPSDGPNIEAVVRGVLMENGMRVPVDDVARATVRATARGNTLRIYWWEDEDPDEMEMGERWMHNARTDGAFLAVYLNLRPDSASTLPELAAMGALAGIVELETETDTWSRDLNDMGAPLE